MEKIEFNKTRKDYCIRGYKNLRCDYFFDLDYLTTPGDLIPENITPKYFYPLVGSRVDFKISWPLQSILMSIVMPKHITEAYKNVDVFGFNLFYKGLNDCGIDVIAGTIYPLKPEILDFKEFCIIFYRKPEDTVSSSTWRRSTYIPGEEVGIYIPKRNNAIFEDKTLILSTKNCLVMYNEEIIFGNYDKNLWNEVMDFVKDVPVVDICDMTEEEADEYNHALEFTFELLTGKKIPEFKLDKNKVLTNAINLISL